MHREKGRLFVVSGPSGVGKGTICRELLTRYPQIRLSVSATTRQARQGEVEGISYYFKSKKEFLEMISEGRMLEYAEVYGNFYGTPTDRILETIGKGEDMILEIEMDGAMQVKQKYPDAVFVFILPPSLDILLERIKGRGTESPESLKRRTQAAVSEIERIVDYDYYIVNDLLEDAVERLKFIIDHHPANGFSASNDEEKDDEGKDKEIRSVLKAMALREGDAARVLPEKLKGGCHVTAINR